MPRKNPSRQIRVDEDLAQRAERLVAPLKWTLNQFGESAMEILCDMIEFPEKRTVPEIVAMLEARKKPSEPLKGVTILSNVEDIDKHLGKKKPALAVAAEEPAKADYPVSQAALDAPSHFTDSTAGRGQYPAKGRSKKPAASK